jgi:hypothetical protein
MTRSTYQVLIRRRGETHGPAGQVNDLVTGGGRPQGRSHP